MFQETSLSIIYTLLLAKKCIKILSCNTLLQNKKSNKSPVVHIYIVLRFINQNLNIKKYRKNVQPYDPNIYHLFRFGQIEIVDPPHNLSASRKWWRSHHGLCQRLLPVKRMGREYTRQIQKREQIRRLDCPRYPEIPSSPPKAFQPPFFIPLRISR